SPERFLSPGTQFYMRWGGFGPHQAEYDRTATGQMLKGETGEFLAHLRKYIQDQAEPLLGQVDPDFAKVVKEVPAALHSIGQNGFSFAIELREINPPKVELTFVFPRSGGPKGPLTKLVKNILQVTGAETKELRVDDTILQHFAIDPIH